MITSRMVRAFSGVLAAAACVGVPLSSPPGRQSSTFAAESASAITPEQLPGVDQFGSDATAYLYRMGWDELKVRLKGTGALRAIEEPEVQAFFDEVRRLGDRDEAIGPVYRFILSALHQELVIAGRSPSPAAPAEKDKAKASQPPEEGARANPDASGAGDKQDRPATLNVAFVRPGPDSKARLRAEHEAMMKTVTGWIGAKTTVDMGPVKFDVLGNKEDGIYTTWKDDRFWWAVGPESAKWATGLSGDRGPESKSLGQADMFRTTVAPLLAGMKDKPVAMYYYDLRPGWRRLAAMEGAGGWDALSWLSLDAVAGASFVEGDGYRNRHYWKVRADHRVGLFAHSQAARINQDWLKRVPAEASGFTTGVWDANSLILSLIGLMAKVSDTDEDHMREVPGFTMPFAPMLKEIGPRYLVYRMPGKYGAFPLADALPLSNMVVITELRDPQAFTTSLKQVCMGPPLSVETTNIVGREVAAVNIMYFTFYFAVMEKEMILTIHPQLMKDALEHWSNPPASIVDTPAYKKAQEYLVPEACFELYIAPGGFSRGIYDRYIPMLQQMIGLTQGMSGMWNERNRPDPRSLGLRPLAFPRGSAFARHAPEATILSARDDGEGVLFDGRAPVLCTPYYWTYLHALARLSPAQGQGVYDLLKFLVMPAGQEEPEARTQRIKEQEPPRAGPKLVE